MNTRRLTPALALLATLVLASGLHAEPLLIAHADLEAEQVSMDQMKRIYLGSSSKLEGVKIKLGTLRDGETHAIFTRWLLEKTPNQFINHWRKIVFSGKGRLPKQFESESALVEFVNSTPGAIGYIDSQTPHDGAKVLRVE